MNQAELKCPVPILQNAFEFSVLFELYYQADCKKMIEIGTFYGGTLYYWLQASIREITCINVEIPPSDSRYDGMVKSKKLWSEWMKDHPDLDYFCYENEDSRSARLIKKIHARYPAKDVDFLFIDGGHDYETVRSDYQNYGPLVHEGGMIALHDVCLIPDVARLWSEIKGSGAKTLEISANDADGCGIGIVFK